MTHEEYLFTIDVALDTLSLDIWSLEKERNWHLRAPFDRRRLNRGAWHRRIYELNEKLIDLRLERAELLVARADEE